VIGPSTLHHPQLAPRAPESIYHAPYAELNDVCLFRLLIQQIFCLHGQFYFGLALSFDLRHQSRLSERECDLQRHQEGQEGRWCTYRCHALMKDGMLEKLFRRV